MLDRALEQSVAVGRKEIAKLTEDDQGDEGLPDPEMFGLVTVLGFEHWLRGQVPPRRTPPNEFATRQAEIFETWRSAGFEVS